MLNLEHLSYSYEGSNGFSIQDISFNIPDGSLVCLLGGNGSGKSTLLYLLSGIFPISKGSIKLDNIEYSKKNINLLREKIALVMQNPNWQIVGSTVKEDAFLGIKSVEEKNKVNMLLSSFLLSDKIDSQVQALSFGQKQKLVLATALYKNPTLLLLDEPFNALDFNAIKEIRSLIKEFISKGVTQIIVSHDLDVILDLSTHIIILEKGRLVYIGKTKESINILLKYNIRPPISWMINGEIISWEELIQIKENEL